MTKSPTNLTNVSPTSSTVIAGSSKGYLGYGKKVDMILLGGLVSLLLIMAVYYFYLRKPSESFQNEVNVVFYFAEWCPHCKNMLPEWEKLPESKEINGKRVRFTKMDCVNEGKEKCMAEQIEGYPTVKCHMPDGESKELYNFERTAEGILKAVSEMLS
jgi:thiol-disulfide isomerase/thioredoxin